jgi:hypothetical protein
VSRTIQEEDRWRARGSGTHAKRSLHEEILPLIIVHVATTAQTAALLLPRLSSLLTMEFFPTVSKIEYKGVESTDPLSFRYYNPEEVILGKPMKDWLRFSVCFWHTFVGGGGSDPFGAKTLERPWEDGLEDDPIALAKRRIDVAFEL